MRRVPAVLGLLCLTIGATSCGSSGDSNAADSTAAPVTSEVATTTAPPTTTPTTMPASGIADLEPFELTTAQYIDILSASIPISLDDATGAGVPTEDRGDAIGGEVAPGVEVFALGADLNAPVQGAVAYLDLAETGGTTPAQFLSGVGGFLSRDGADVLEAFNRSVVPALSSITESTQRFSLGSVTLELTVIDNTTLAFAYLAGGQAVPPAVYNI
jgi:hypothetical protein